MTEPVVKAKEDPYLVFLRDQRRWGRATQEQRAKAKVPLRAFLRALSAATKAGRRGRKARARMARIAAAGRLPG